MTRKHLRSEFPSEIDVVSTNRRVVSIFALNIKRLILAMSQTGYDCRYFPDGVCYRPALVVSVPRGIRKSIYEPLPLSKEVMRCGGNESFINGVKGRSDLCSTQVFCTVPQNVVDFTGPELTTNISEVYEELALSRGFAGSFVEPSAPSEFFSGWVQLEIDQANVAYASTLCTQFRGTLFASSATADGLPATTSFTGFPLQGRDGVFTPLLAVKIGNHSSRAAAAASINVGENDLIALPALQDLFSPDDARDAFLGNLSTPSRHNASISHACVMDWISASIGFCTIPVPEGASFASIKVAMTDFVPSANVMTVMFMTKSKVLANIQCGGRSGFSFQPSYTDRCTTFHDCGTGILPTDSEPVSSIVISVPATVGLSTTCRAAFVALVDFTPPSSTVDLSDCPFLCKADAKCIPERSVCDNVVDCSDGADEVRCSDWSLIESGFLFNLSTAQNHTVLSLRECRTTALAAGSKVLAINNDQTLCIIYTAKDGKAYVADPTPQVIRDTSFSMYAVLTTAYSRCSAEVTCSGHGTLITTQVAGRTLCSCICDKGFSGIKCDTVLDMKSVGDLVVTTTVNCAVDVELAITKFVDSSELTVTCGASFLAGATETQTECKIDGPDEEIQRVYKEVEETDALSRIQAAAFNASCIKSATARTQPVLQEFACGQATGSGGGESVCPTGGSKIGSIRVGVPASGGISSMTINAITKGRRSGSSSMSCTAEKGNLKSSVLPNGCTVTTCVVEPEPGNEEADEIAVQLPSYDSANDPCYEAPKVAVTAPLDIPALESTAPINLDAEYSKTLIAAIIFMICAFFVLTAFAFLVRQHLIAYRSASKNADGAMDSGHQVHRSNSLANGAMHSELQRQLLDSVKQMSYFQSARLIEWEKWAGVLGVIGFDLMAFGLFLLLMFVTSAEYSSNVEVLFETYRADSCGLSTVSPLPLSVSLITHDTARSCLQREIVGSTAAGVFFASATCGPNNTVYIQYGRSLRSCTGFKTLVVQSGQCFPFQWLSPKSTVATFVAASCGTRASVFTRYRYMKNLDDTKPVAAFTRVKDIPRPLQQSWDNPSLINRGSAPFQHRRVQALRIHNPSSNSQFRFETQVSNASLLIGSATDRDRLVVQTYDEVFNDTTTGALSEAFLLPTTDLRQLSPQVQYRGTRNGDYPIGFMYGLGSDRQDERAGAEAARYYGVQNSGAEIAKYFSSQKRDNYGFTISLYLRATHETQGFAFAVADARENLKDRNSPLLNDLIKIIAGGAANASWPATPFNVYSSLYVSGPNRRLYFAYANSRYDQYGNVDPLITGNQVVVLSWDVEALDKVSLFNGLWHHVAVVIRNENSQVKAQLIVDGKTSEEDQGWNQCIDRTPAPIKTFDLEVQLPVTNAQEERVQAGGVLFAGYLNGGVAQLEFTPQRLTIYDIWFTTTNAIRQNNPFEENAYLALGIVLLITGVVLIVVMMLTSARELAQVDERYAEFVVADAKSHYRQLWAKEPRDEDDRRYNELPYEEARQLLGFEHEMMAAFLDQVEQSHSKKAAFELIRMLYAKSIVPPTATEWNFHFPSAIVVPESEDSQDCEMKAKNPLTSNPQQNTDGTFAAVGPSAEGGANPNDTTTAAEPDLWGATTGDVAYNPMTLFEQQHAGMDEELQPIVTFGEITTTDDRPAKPKKQRKNSRQGRKMSVASPTGKYIPAEMNLGGEFIESIQSVLLVLQSVTVWMTCLPMPAEYFATFKDAFFIVELDIGSFVRNPVLTPTIQMFMAMIIASLLFAFVALDDVTFVSNLARYVIRRDELYAEEHPGASGAHTFLADITLLTREDKLFGELPPNGFDFRIPLMPVSQSELIDVFTGKSRLKRLEDVHRAETMLVEDSDGRSYTLTKEKDLMALAKGIAPPVGFAPSVKVTSRDVDKTTDLTTPSTRCPLHFFVPLGEQSQIDVWPYDVRPFSRAEIDGKLCMETRGPMYVCGHVESMENPDDGEKRQVSCTFALCERHYAAPLYMQFLAPVLMVFRQLKLKGPLWFIVALAVILANALYMPILKTSLLILICDPFYSCSFPTCWNKPDRTFVIAGFLCIVVIVYFGILYPLALIVVLRRRKFMMHNAFFAEEYAGRFQDENEVLHMSEWRRYLATDSSALSKIYQTFEFKWLYLPPVILLWKFGVLVPAIYAKRNSFEQLLGVSLVQLGFAVFLSVTEPSISPMVDLMYKFGGAHQMFILGSLALDIRQRYLGKPRLDSLLVFFTVLYLIVSGFFIATVSVLPFLMKFWKRRQTTMQFEKYGLPWDTTKYMVPCEESYVKAPESRVVTPKSSKNNQLTRALSQDELVFPIHVAYQHDDTQRFVATPQVGVTDFDTPRQTPLPDTVEAPNSSNTNNNIGASEGALTRMNTADALQQDDAQPFRPSSGDRVRSSPPAAAEVAAASSD